MGCLLAIFAAISPRLMLVLTFFLSTFFHRAIPGSTLFFALIGLLFCPLSFMWYCAVQNWFDGGWGCFQIVVMIICISTDLGSHGATAKGAKARKGEAAASD